eukprot:6432731-Ditylum_brightwellii.AAC.1
MTQERDIIDQALAADMHVMQITIALVLGSTPGALPFSRDMFLNIPLIAYWKAITTYHKQQVNDSL